MKIKEIIILYKLLVALLAYISNFVVSDVDLAGPASYTQWIIVKIILKSLLFFT